MGKIFLLLTIIFSQTQACLTNSENLTSQVISENQDLAKDKKPQTWREYCDNEFASAKSRLNNGYNLVKDNPKTSFSIATNVILTGMIIYILLNRYKFDDNLLNVKLNPDSPDYKPKLEQLISAYYEELSTSKKVFKQLFANCSPEEINAISSKLQLYPDLYAYAKKFYPDKYH